MLGELMPFANKAASELPPPEFHIPSLLCILTNVELIV